MRYEIGQKIWGVFFHNTDAIFYPHYSPWSPFGFNVRRSEMPRMEFIELTVTEHHKVYWEYDEKKAEPTNDGFVLTDEKGRVWHNQYPRASYEQTSDHADGLFSLCMEKEKAIYNETLDYIRDRRDAREAGRVQHMPNAPHLIQVYDLMRELSSINYAAHHMQERAADPKKDAEATEQLNLLNCWYARILSQFKEATGLGIESSPLIFKMDGEEHTLPGRYKFKPVKPE